MDAIKEYNNSQDAASKTIANQLRAPIIANLKSKN